MGLKKVLGEIYYVYMLIFPDMRLYFGLTGMKQPVQRIKQHYFKILRGEYYDGIKQLPKWKIIGSGDLFTMGCLEYYLIDMFWGDDRLINPTKPWKPHIQKIRIEQGREQAEKQYVSESGKEYYKARPPEQVQRQKARGKLQRQSKLGRLTSAINVARRNLKLHTGLERWDMVERWKVIEKERIQAREEYKNSDEYKYNKKLNKLF